MNRKSFSTAAILCLAVVLLTGCAAQRAYKEGKGLIEQGNVEEGLAKIEQASALDPANKEYRLAFYRSRDTVTFQILAQADVARDKGKWEEAEASYQRVLKVNPGNPRAQAGVDSIVAERRHQLLMREAEEAFNKDDGQGLALQTVLKILSENPAHRGALALRRSIDAKSAKTSTLPFALKSALKKPITLEFRDAGLQTVFEMISKSAKINFLFDKEVRQDMRTTLFVRDAYIEDVIRFILVTNQLESKALNENTLLIYPNTPQKLRDFQELAVKSFYLSNADAKQTAGLIKTMVKTKDIFVDEKFNMLVMRDTPQAIRMAEKLIASQDLMSPEVVLEVEVLEVSSNILRELGIRYPDQISYSLVGAAGTAGSMTLSEFNNINARMVRVAITNPALVITLKNQEGNSNLLANPRIRVKNREKAKIHIGDKVPVITSTSTATGIVGESVNYLDIGLKLDVEPTVYLNDEVGIKVGMEVSNIVREIRSSTGTLTYQVGTRNAATTLQLKDGETQILAGLISDEDRKTATKVPGLGHLPIVGRLFSNDNDTVSKTEVVLLITPHIVRNLVRTEGQNEEFMSGTEAVVGAPLMQLRSGEVHATKSDRPTPAAHETPATQAQLTMQVPPQAILGSEFQVALNLAASAVQRTAFDLVFDPSLIQVVKVEEGEFMKAGGGTTQFLHQIKNDTGRVNVRIVRPGEAQGKGVVATVTFKVVANAPGNAHISLEGLNLIDASSKPIFAALPPVADVALGK